MDNMLHMPQLCEITEQEREDISGVGDNNVRVTPVSVTVRGPQGMATGVGRGAQLASMVEHSARASPLRYPAVDTRVPSVSSSQPEHVSSSQPGNDDSEESQKAIGGENENRTQLQALAELVKQLGSEIGNQVAASLAGAGPSTSPPQPIVEIPDWSKVNLILKSDVREPPHFRGDSTDRCTVTEWQELMQAYLKKKGCSISEQGQEIQDRLMGRAKDIVRIGLRGNPLVNISRDPEAIYNILRQHFGEAISSTIPLGYFYETLPRQSESCLDYWVRLNKAIDLANECLQRQGKRVDDPGHEVTMMFVKHCPDPALYAALRCRPIENWTVGDLQAMIDSHHRDKQSARHRAQSTAKVEVVMTPDAWCMTQQQAVGQNNSATPTNSDQAPLNKVISLLEKLLSTQEQNQRRTSARTPQTNTAAGPCRICKASDHSTQSHCFKEGLCLKCHRTGHRGFECPARKQVGEATAEAPPGPALN